MTKHGTKDSDPAVKARAEALFRLREEQKREGQSASITNLTNISNGVTVMIAHLAHVDPALIARAHDCLLL